MARTSIGSASGQSRAAASGGIWIRCMDHLWKEPVPPFANGAPPWHHSAIGSGCPNRAMTMNARVLGLILLLLPVMAGCGGTVSATGHAQNMAGITRAEAQTLPVPELARRVL